MAPSPPPPLSVKIIEQSQVSPPPGSVPTTSLPLTFFDLLWHLCCPIQRLFFYEFPHPNHHFLQTLLPTLKHSLSLTLHHFFPFAGNLICPPSPEKPHVLYAAGDFVPFAIAESADDKFDRLIADHPRDVRELHHFVPKLLPALADGGGARVVPLMALQVTVFPNSGFSIGVTFCHLAADGRAFHHFMKSWASVCKAGGDQDLELPCHDRDLIKVPTGLELDLLKDFWYWASTLKEDAGPSSVQLAGKVRATFVVGQAQIERLKHWTRNQCTHEELEPLHISTFVVTCALFWVSLIKSEEIETTRILDKNDDEPYFFVYSADCRNRLEPIPITYFGNCLTFSIVWVKRRELLGVNGIMAGVRAIGKNVGELEKNGALEGAENWMKDWKEIVEKYRFVTVAGSQKLGIYETDFGWGRPKKTELVHTDVSGAISLSDSRDDKHGVEVSLALSRDQMNRFNAILEESLKKII